MRDGSPPPDPPLADAVVSLRPLAATDIPVVEEALDDPEICRWFDNRDLSARDVIERAAARWESAEAAEFALVDAGERRGSLWLNLGNDGRATVGLSFSLLPSDRASA